MWAGQSVGLIHNLPGAAEVVELTIREARAVLMGQLAKEVRLRGFGRAFDQGINTIETTRGEPA
jgi:hypothetical protein